MNTPCQVSIELVRSVCAGAQRSAAVTREGSLFTWGSNGIGQLGHGDTTDRSIPAAVTSIAHLAVEQVATGFSCMLVVDAEGSILMTGKLNMVSEGPSSTSPWVP